MSEPDRGTGSDDGGSEASAGFDAATQRRIVRERYARIATESGEEGGCCSGDGASPDAGGGRCGGDDDDGPADAEGTAELLGYAAEDVESVEGDANLGLGCGNPQALAEMSRGETVLDMGSGAGFDCFLAAREVGPTGRVVGVDMTPEMVEKARENARENGTDHVEFRLGEIEHLPVADGTVDVVISNCVVNLSPDKPRVFREAYRVLRPGGRLAVSDVVLTAPVPADLRADPDSVAACVAGASTVGRVEEMLDVAGFVDVAVDPENDSDRFIREWDDEHDPSEFVVSASITARKPDSGDRSGSRDGTGTGSRED
jgi:SAM-dependent methyltransferase